jgi:hypothetical protein
MDFLIQHTCGHGEEEELFPVSPELPRDDPVWHFLSQNALNYSIRGAGQVEEDHLLDAIDNHCQRINKKKPPRRYFVPGARQ